MEEGHHEDKNFFTKTKEKMSGLNKKVTGNLKTLKCVCIILLGISIIVIAWNVIQFIIGFKFFSLRNILE